MPINSASTSTDPNSIHPRPSPSPLLDPMSQTMLLTKRLTTFLSQNTTPQLPTLILLSPTGKLLSSSSPLPASTLRTQATLACSLWTLYQPSASSLISSAISLPTFQSISQTHPRGSDATLSSTTTAAENDLSTITVQLSHGIMVIRALGCGLLFVAVGPSSLAASSPYPSPHTLHAQSLSSHTSPPSSPTAHGEIHGYDGTGTHGERDMSASNLVGLGSGAPSEAGSVGSTGTRTGNIMGVKRQAEEVGKWLDVQLEGFMLSSAEGR